MVMKIARELRISLVRSSANALRIRQFLLRGKEAVISTETFARSWHSTGESIDRVQSFLDRQEYIHRDADPDVGWQPNIIISQFSCLVDALLAGVTMEDIRDFHGAGYKRHESPLPGEFSGLTATFNDLMEGREPDKTYRQEFIDLGVEMAELDDQRRRSMASRERLEELKKRLSDMHPRTFKPYGLRLMEVLLEERGRLSGYGEYEKIAEEVHEYLLRLEGVSAKFLHIHP